MFLGHPGRVPPAVVAGARSPVGIGMFARGTRGGCRQLVQPHGRLYHRPWPCFESKARHGSWSARAPVTFRPIAGSPLRRALSVWSERMSSFVSGTASPVSARILASFRRRSTRSRSTARRAASGPAPARPVLRAPPPAGPRVVVRSANGPFETGLSMANGLANENKNACKSAPSCLSRKPPSVNGGSRVQIPPPALNSGERLDRALRC
jgi:hypothetical protein